MTMPLSGQSTIVLTGATSGIGACIKDRLLAAGHTVIAVSRGAARIPAHPGLVALTCDLADPGKVRTIASRIATDHARIDLLINNAGFQHAKPLTAPDIDIDAMIAEAQVNLVAPALFAHALLPALRTAGDGAAIVNISSGLAYYPKRDTALYCATKAGLHSFSQSLRYQLEGANIRVIEAILPLVATPMTEGRGAGKITAGAAADAILAAIPRWILKAS
jgi:uncharacterized oxidoreductase